MTRFIALLRAVNVGGRTIKMEALRDVAEKVGCMEVQSYIASGNLVFTAAGTSVAWEAKLEKATGAKFGIEVPVVVRSTEDWKAYLESPFPNAPPNRVTLGLPKAKPKPTCEKTLQARAADGEVVKVAGDALWIHYPNGQGRSKITPAAVDKAVGSPTTQRNLNTVRKLAELAAPP
ncbi:MAG: DUF1697 domain-containing protein [Thermoplasmatota archaeon]